METLNLVPRDYQKAIFETAKEKNTLAVLPTGLGKTLIALLLSVERLKKFPTSKVLFLAPTKPLVEQHFATFKKELPELFADLQLFTGEVPPKSRTKIFQTAEIIFSTPQCIANDLTRGLYSLSEISLIIFDEAHRCLNNYDYTKVAQFYKNQSQNQRILGMTASPGHDIEKVRQICKHLGIEEIESRTRASEDVKDYLEELNFEKVLVPFPPEFLEIKLLLKRLFDSSANKLKEKGYLHSAVNKITLLNLQKRLFTQISSTNFAAMYGVSLTAQAIKVSHAIELLETQTLSGLNDYLRGLIKQAEENKSRAVKILVKSPEFNAAFISVQNLLTKKVEHPKLDKLKEIVNSELKANPRLKVIIFAQFRNTLVKISKILNEIPGINARVFVGQAKKGEGKEQTGLSQKEQQEMINQFSLGEINALCASQIGEEGLDICEVSNVIFYEPIPSEIRTIQRRGRTARLMKGKLTILITEKTRDEIYYWSAFNKEKKMYKEIDKISKEFKNANQNIEKKQPNLNDFS